MNPFLLKLPLPSYFSTFQLFKVMFCQVQCAKIAVSDSPGLVDFVMGLVNNFCF